MFYFAYGSNMNHSQMKSRCPDGKFIASARLAGFRFVYDGFSTKRNGPVANVVRDENSEVRGGVYDISQDDLISLNRSEGYPNSYGRELFAVIDEKGNSYAAYIYLRKNQEEGIPTKEYRDIVIQGAKDCGLSKEYIKQL